MLRPLFVTMIEKFRGRSLATIFTRWERGSWERRLERADEEARRLAEDYKRRERSKGSPR